MKVNLQKEIKAITEQIIRKYKPEKIILFGSAVNGNFTTDSDLDFLIVKKNIPYFGRERARELRRLIKKKIAADFLIYQPEEFNKYLNLDDPFLKAIVKEGKILYDS